MSNRAKEYMDFVRKSYEVRLPSGPIFLIRKPQAFWFAAQTGTLPILTPEELKAAAESTTPTAAIIERNAKLTKLLIQDHVLEPKIVDNPDYEAGEIGFNDLLPEDAKFIMDYLSGLVDAKGSSISSFPGESESATSGTTSGNMANAA
jgi:hypothetical protein